MGKRTTAVAVFVVASLAFAVAGLAYFAATGSGQGPAYLANTQNLTVSPASPSGSELYPGGSADIAATVHNPNAGPVHIHSFVLDLSQGGGTGITDDKSPDCPASSVTFNGPALHDGGLTDFVFPPGDTTLTLSNALTMSLSAPDACQGATFTVYLQAANA